MNGSTDVPGESNEISEQPASETRSGVDPSVDQSSGFDEVCPVAEPIDDAVTLELVRDAIGVARWEVSDERFAMKYETMAGQCDTGVDSANSSERS